MTRTAVIGAGASGLSLALALDGDVTVYEASNAPGGHCATTVRDGFTFDRGPHIMFSRDPEVLGFMVDSLEGNVHRSRRNNRVAVAGRLPRYPLENDLASLPEELRNTILLDFLFNEHAAGDEAPANLEEWALSTFGEAFTSAYFKPYNEKVWNVPLAELSMSWAGRIPQPPARDVVAGALGIATEGYLHQLHFHYPRRGGYQAITDAWAQRLRPGVLRLNSPVAAIARDGEQVAVTTPRGTERFDRVVSTAPIPALIDMLGDPPAPVEAAVSCLQVNAVGVVTLGFRGVDENQFTAVYFADPDFLVNRASFPCVFSPHNGPAGRYSIQAEITAAPWQSTLERSDEELVAHVLDGLRRYGLAARDHEHVFSDVARYEHGYVVYRVGYEAHVETVRAFARDRGVELHGRFGSFEYLNVDGCVAQSLRLASRLNGRATALDELRGRARAAA